VKYKSSFVILFGLFTFSIFLLRCTDTGFRTEQQLLLDSNFDTNYVSKTFISNKIIGNSIIEYDGQIWIGTKRNGLYLLNKKTGEIKRLNTTNSELPGNTITSLKVDASGNLWMLCNNELVTFSKGKFNKINPNGLNLNTIRINDFTLCQNGNLILEITENINNSDIDCLIIYNLNNSSKTKLMNAYSPAIDIQNAVWLFASPSWLEGGLVKYNSSFGFKSGRGQKFYTDLFEKKYGGVEKILIDDNDRKWIALTRVGRMNTDNSVAPLIVFDKKGYHFFDIKNTALSDEGIRDMTFDKKGNLWIIEEDWTQRIVKFDGKNWSTFLFGEMKLENAKYVNKVYCDHDGDIWLTSNVGGVARYNGKTWISYDLGNSDIPSNNVLAFSEDKKGNIWVGTQQGIALAKHDSIFLFKEILTGYEQGRRAFVRAMTSDKNGNIWVGLEQPFVMSSLFRGLLKFDGTNWTMVEKYKRLTIGAIIQDNTGSIYFGAENKVFKILNEQEFKDTIPSTANLIENTIKSIAFDNNKNIWLIPDWYYETGKVLVCDTLKNWKIYDSKNSDLPSDTVNYIAIDKQNNKWIATGKGLLKISNTKWSVYNTDNSAIPDNYVTCIAIDASQNIWVGTKNGLALFKNNKFTVLNSKNTNLISNEIKTIFIDSNNNKWIGTWAGGVTFLKERTF